jgi:6-phosphogluconolactonase (cycloisomerase 2 family)
VVGKRVLWIVLLAFSLVLPSTIGAASVAIFEFVEIQQQGVGGVVGLSDVTSATVSPDGLSVYATGAHNGLAVFAREPVSGRLAFLELHTDNQNGVDGLDAPWSVAVSPDNTSVYATGMEDNGLAVFSRETGTAPIGTLAFVEAKKDGVGDVVDGLGGADRVAVSPDSKNVYVTGSTDDALVVFSRDTTTGALSFVELHQEGVGNVEGLDGAKSVTVSPDNRNVYVTGDPAGVRDDALVVFGRDASTGELTFLEVHKRGSTNAQGLGGPESVVVSPDGQHVYVAADIDDSVVLFGRHPVSGRLTFVQKFGELEAGPDTLNGAVSVALNPNGKCVFVVSRLTDSLLVFWRNTWDGRLLIWEQHKDNVGGVNGLDAPLSVVASSDNQNVYVSSNDDDALSIFGRVSECPDTHLVRIPVVLTEE